MIINFQAEQDFASVILLIHYLSRYLLQLLGPILCTHIDQKIVLRIVKKEVYTHHSSPFIFHTAISVITDTNMIKSDFHNFHQMHALFF
jgi:hypothetical protein